VEKSILNLVDKSLVKHCFSLHNLLRYYIIFLTTNIYIYIYIYLKIYFETFVTNDFSIFWRTAALIQKQ